MIKESNLFDGFMCGCGTNILIKDEETLYYQIPNDIVVKMSKLAFECKINSVLEGKNALFFEGESIKNPRVQKNY